MGFKSIMKDIAESAQTYREMQIEADEAKIELLKDAIADMKASMKAQHKVDKANFAAIKAESKERFERARRVSQQIHKTCRVNTTSKNVKPSPDTNSKSTNCIK